MCHQRVGVCVLPREDVAQPSPGKLHHDLAPTCPPPPPKEDISKKQAHGGEAAWRVGWPGCVVRGLALALALPTG